MKEICCAVISTILLVTILVCVAVASSEKVAVLARQATAYRTQFLKELEQIKQGDTEVCAALPITDAMRGLMKTHRISYQPNATPTATTPSESMQAFPSLADKHPYWLFPPLADGKEFGVELFSFTDHGAYSVDRHDVRINRFRAHSVVGSNPLRFRLESLNEIDFDSPHFGDGLI